MQAGISAGRESWYLPALKSAGTLLPGSEVSRLFLHCSFPPDQWFVAVERSHEVGDVGQRGTWHNKSRLKYIFNLGMCF